MISFATFQLFLIKFMTYFGNEKNRVSLIISLFCKKKVSNLFFGNFSIEWGLKVAIFKSNFGETCYPFLLGREKTSTGEKGWVDKTEVISTLSHTTLWH